MIQEFIVIHLPEAIQKIANEYKKESYGNVIDTINGASPDELASSLSDALCPWFGRDDWMKLENIVYDKLVYCDDAKKNVKGMKDLLIANLNFVELFK